MAAPGGMRSRRISRLRRRCERWRPTTRSVLPAFQPQAVLSAGRLKGSTSQIRLQVTCLKFSGRLFHSRRSDRDSPPISHADGLVNIFCVLLLLLNCPLVTAGWCKARLLAGLPPRRSHPIDPVSFEAAVLFELAESTANLVSQIILVCASPSSRD